MSKKIKLEENTRQVARNEILQIADIVAREKGIDKEEILGAMEAAILKIAQAKYGEEKKLEVIIDRKTGEIEINRILLVVENVHNINTEVGLEDVKSAYPSIQLGETIKDKLPALDFGRVSAQSARQIIIQKVRTAERIKQSEEFANRIGEIITGVVKRVEYTDVIFDISGKAEGIIKKSEMIPREIFRVGDRIKVLLVGINKEQTGPLLMLSRTHPDFLKKLFEQEVPEVYDGVIKIMAVARDPGSKAKVAVTTSDPNLDAIGACVGLKGARVQAIVDELKGEKVDIVLWSENPAMFIVNSLSPADVSKIVMDETEDRVTAVVPDNKLSSAIGRRGQNVRLASKLTGWVINVTTESEETKARAKETNRILNLLMKNLDVDEMVAHLLMGEGFSSIEDIALTPLSELASIEGFDNEIAEELQQRAKSYIDKKQEDVYKLCEEKGVSQDLKEYKLLKPELLEVLVKADIKSLDDLGDLSKDELMDIAGDLLSESEAGALIMKIRENWFK